MSGPPDFLIIGAMKCGTSTLQAQLAAQPGVFMTDPKEPNYFSDDEIFARGAAWYDGLFRDARPGDLRGEASTHYTKLPTYAHTLGRMAARLTAPKLIYMMRDPVERALSHYLHEYSRGAMGGDPVRAFRKHPELIDYGRYAMQIAPFVDRFGAQAILLLRLEEMRADPDAVFARVGRFLGREAIAWDHAMPPANVSSERVRKLPLHRMLVDNRAAEVLRRSLVPKSWRERIRKSRQIRQAPELPPALVAELREIFAADNAELARLFPGDPALVSAEAGAA